MSTIRKLDPAHRLERDRRREALAQVMAASPHTRLGATASTLSKIYRSPAMSGAEKTQRFMNVFAWAASHRNENWALKVR
jgi:hypothetical protein